MIHKLLTFLAIIFPLYVNISFASERYIPLNQAINMDFDQDINTVFISNPDVANYKIINKRTLVVFTNKVGQSQIIVYGDDKEILLSQLIHVDINLTDIRRQIAIYYPDLEIKLTSIGNNVVVSGKVYSEEQRGDIYRTIAELLGRKKVTRYNSADKITLSNDGSDFDERQWVSFQRDYSWEGITERLEIDSIKQVNVKISVVQVSKEFNETLGVDWSSIGQSTGQFVFQQFDAASLTTIVSAIGDDSIAEVLAEPNLTVMSGESASFLVGGEVPVIVTNQNTTNISFKEFGVKLSLSAKVQNNKKIKLNIAPEVSAIERIIKAAGIEVPQLSTRRALTTIVLADGDSFMIGGLMSSEDIEAISRVPLLGDIPILGAAFRKATTKRKKTELIIVATVNLVKPITSQDVRLPMIHKTSTLSRLFGTYDSKKSREVQARDALTIDMLNRGGFIQ
jgi:pilus assembly protein CpaC